LAPWGAGYWLKSRRPSPSLDFPNAWLTGGEAAAVSKRANVSLVPASARAVRCGRSISPGWSGCGGMIGITFRLFRHQLSNNRHRTLNLRRTGQPAAARSTVARKNRPSAPAPKGWRFQASSRDGESIARKPYSRSTCAHAWHLNSLTAHLQKRRKAHPRPAIPLRAQHAHLGAAVGYRARPDGSRTLMGDLPAVWCSGFRSLSP
jgi:hypothetical protein